MYAIRSYYGDPGILAERTFGIGLEIPCDGSTGRDDDGNDNGGDE